MKQLTKYIFTLLSLLLLVSNQSIAQSKWVPIVMEDITISVPNPSASGGQTNSGNTVSGNAVIGHYFTQVLPETHISRDAKRIECPAVSSDGSKVYFGLDDEFIILDVGNPSNIRKLGSYKTGNSIYKIVLSNDKTKAYLANSYSGFVIVDISDSSSPKELESYSQNTTEIALSKDERMVYYAGNIHDNGVYSLDISDLDKYKDRYKTLYRIRDIALSNDETRIYALNNDSELITLDITELDKKPLNIYDIEMFNSYREANNMVLSKDSKKAYITDGTKFIILDISDEESGPKEIGRVGDIKDTHSMVLSPDGTKAYVTDSYEGLAVVDIRDASNPKIVGYYDVDTYYGYGIAISSDGTKAYLGNLYNDNKIGLSIIDLTKPFRTTKK